MPYPVHALESFKRQYGQKEGVRRFFQWKNANPGQFAKALSTARREGPSHVAAHSATRRTPSHIVERVRHRRHK